MPKPFDATTKRLVEMEPTAWLEYLGLPGTQPELIEADLTTINAEADKVLRVFFLGPYLVHIEFQASYDPEMGKRVLRYNVLLYYRHGLPVQSVVVLLHRDADGPEMKEQVEYAVPGGDTVITFHYKIVRVWEKRVDWERCRWLPLPESPAPNCRRSFNAWGSVLTAKFRPAKRAFSGRPPICSWDYATVLH